MNIPNDPNNFQKRFEAQIAGQKGMRYAKVIPNKKIEKILEKLKKWLAEFTEKNKQI